MSNMLKWAEEELKRYGYTFYGEGMNDDVLEILKILIDQGHTNMSASIVIQLVDRLWSWKPLTSLTGEDDEWTDDLDPTGDKWQNKRYSAVFKNKETGECYDIEGRIFAEPNGVTFTCRQSRVPIEFPYMPPDKYPVYQLKYPSDEKSVEEQLKDGDYEIQ
ncbi:MAG: hypothetical protein J6F30_04230 [Cellulosilyticum sp.]|nr:hypothetical protein [Cellulosilyticum sp.]